MPWYCLRLSSVIFVGFWMFEYWRRTCSNSSKSPRMLGPLIATHLAPATSKTDNNKIWIWSSRVNTENGLIHSVMYGLPISLTLCTYIDIYRFQVWMFEQIDVSLFASSQIFSSVSIKLSANHKLLSLVVPRITRIRRAAS